MPNQFHPGIPTEAIDEVQNHPDVFKIPLAPHLLAPTPPRRPAGRAGAFGPACAAPAELRQDAAGRVAFALLRQQFEQLARHSSCPGVVIGG